MFLKNNIRFISVQRGARRGYAVPLILSKAGVLERFYTDICGNIGVGKFLSSFGFLQLVGSALNRLANRRVPQEIVDRTHTSPFFWVKRELLSHISNRDPESQFKRHLNTTREWGRFIESEGFGEATHVYSMLSEGGPYLRNARRAGLKVIAEVYILLSAEQIIETERQHFPDWEPHQPIWSELRARLDKNNYLINDVDEYVCPSEAVRDDLVKNWGIKAGRCHLVPYGMSPHWLEIEPNPVHGRVLFVGTAELRKGIHYLAKAAELLHQRGKNYEFRIAGNVSERVRQQPICQHLKFLGRVPRNEIHEEFQQAAIFTLPSLAEGSAEVTYEALGAALPLVVTNAAGSIVRDGIEGRIVPERDPYALAEAIEELMENPEVRLHMALAARERAREYTWDKYGERLLSMLKNLS